MPAVTPVTAESIFERARFFLNDENADVYTNAKLIEPLNIALDDLREELQDNDISVTAETSAAIEVEAGVTDIGGPTGPALPNDFLVPINLYERTSGTNMDYMLMQKKEFLPHVQNDPRGMFLEVWTYQNQIIKFLGAASDIDVKINYRANRIYDVINENSQVNLINAKSFLALQTAGYAAEYVGENESRAASLYSKADKALEMLLNLDIKNKQNQTTRHRPFMARFKSRGGLYG